MRFVSPETTKIELKDGFYIEVKKELSAIEEKRLRGAGMKRMSQREGEDGKPTNDVEIDFAALALARVHAYLVDWNAKGPNGKDMPVSKDSINQLAPESFDEIDAAIVAHIEAMVAEKKDQSGSPSLSAA